MKTKPAAPTAKRKTTKRPVSARTRASAKAASAKTRLITARQTPAAKTKRARAKGKITKRSPGTRKAAVEIPPILLEGDRPSAPLVSGPGEKFVLGPTPPPQESGLETAELPAAYGTGRLYFTARDPHWLYANWDLTRAQQSRFNAQSADGHLVLRIFRGDTADPAVSEIHVHPESRHWFAHVETAAANYVAELGFFRPGRKWQSIATSNPARTPPDARSCDTTVAFATIPVEVPFEQLVAIVKQAAGEHAPLAVALEELRRRGHPDLPATAGSDVSEWTPEQERALAEVIHLDPVRRVWIGSLEIAELIHGEREQEISSIGAAQFSLPSSLEGAAPGVSSPSFGPPAHGKGFWFAVNAELIIYGATERDANVTIGGSKIELRSDGTFSYRFALPDGHYDLPVVAVSADETDSRAAELKFSRSTDFLGEVGAEPQDPALLTPAAENV